MTGPLPVCVCLCVSLLASNGHLNLKSKWLLGVNNNNDNKNAGRPHDRCSVNAQSLKQKAAVRLFQYRARKSANLRDYE